MTASRHLRIKTSVHIVSCLSFEFSLGPSYRTASPAGMGTVHDT